MPLPNIKTLRLEDLTFSSGGLRCVGTCTTLTSLSLRQSSADSTALCLDGVDRLRQLTHLDLNKAQVADVAPLALCTSLQSLSVRRTLVQDLSPLAQCTALETLIASYCHRLREATLCWLPPSLTRLDLAGTTLSDALLAGSVARLPGLRQLQLRCTTISDVSCLVTCCPQLAVLDVRASSAHNVACLSSLASLKLFYPASQVRYRPDTLPESVEIVY